MFTNKVKEAFERKLNAALKEQTDALEQLRAAEERSDALNAEIQELREKIDISDAFVEKSIESMRQLGFTEEAIDEALAAQFKDAVGDETTPEGKADEAKPSPSERSLADVAMDVVAFLDANSGRWTCAHIADKTRNNQRRVASALKKLAKDGDVEVSGSRRWTFYSLKAKW